jgi:hypothetical protein
MVEVHHVQLISDVPKMYDEDSTQVCGPRKKALRHRDGGFNTEYNDSACPRAMFTIWESSVVVIAFAVAVNDGIG